MSAQDWQALGRKQFTGNCQDIRDLSLYWYNTAATLAHVSKPETDALGATAKNFDAAFAEMVLAFKEAQDQAAHLGDLCSRWTKELAYFQAHAEEYALMAGQAQEAITAAERELAGLKTEGIRSSLEVYRERAINERINSARTTLTYIQQKFDHLADNYHYLLQNFQHSYQSPSFISVTAETNSASPLGRRIAVAIGQLEQDRPDLVEKLEFLQAMLPFDDSGRVEASFFYNDLFFAHCEMVEKVLCSFRLDVGPDAGAAPSKTLAKLIGFDGDIYFPNPIREKLKLASGLIGSGLKKVDLERIIKKGLDNNLKNLDDWTRQFAGNTDELAPIIAASIRRAFPKYKLPIDLGDSEIIAKNAQVIAEKGQGVLASSARHLPKVSKVVKKVPVVGTAISAGMNYSDYYQTDQHSSSSEGEKRARAAGASLAVTGTGMVAGAAGGAAAGAMLGSIVPGVGTAIGGLVGGIAGGIIAGTAGEEGAKAIHLDDWMADRFGDTYRGIQEKMDRGGYDSSYGNN